MRTKGTTALRRQRFMFSVIYN